MDYHEANQEAVHTWCGHSRQAWEALDPFRDQQASVMGREEQERLLLRMVQEVKDSPFALCDWFRWEPTPQQAAILRDVEAGYPKIAVKAGRGVGKTTLGGMVAYWRILRQRDALVILTAPSMKQCSDVFIMEMKRRLVDAHPLLKSLFSFTARKVFVGKRGSDENNDPHWGLMAVTAADPVNIQGFHQECLTFIEDEASGTERDFCGAIEGTMTQESGDRLHLQQGNPNYRDSAFFDSFHRKRQWFRCHTLSAAESPIVSKQWVEYMRSVYGEGSPVFKVHVMGQFPDVDPNAIMSIEDLEACTKTDVRTMQDRLTGKKITKQFGIDLARFGGDESTIYLRRGHAILDYRVIHMTEPEDVVAAAFAMQESYGWKDSEVEYVADADGLGQGVMARFVKANKRLLEFHTQSSAWNPEMFSNRMTEAWFTFARLVKQHDCWLPNDPVLLQQLSTRLYDLDPKGRLRVEPKQEYKKRMKSETLESTDSPDRADGIVMAFYQDTGRSKVALL